MFNIGTPELFLILIVALIVVGPRRLPEIGRTVGRVMSEFRKAQDEVRDMVKFDLSDAAPTATETHPGPTPHPTRVFDEPEHGPGDVPIDTVELPDRATPGAGSESQPDDSSQAPAE
jgi:Tat protein translocase TatB subunit